MKKVIFIIIFYTFLSTISAFTQEEVYQGVFSEGDAVNEQGWYEYSYTIEVPVGKLLIADLYSEDFDPYLTVVTPSGEEQRQAAAIPLLQLLSPNQGLSNSTSGCKLAVFSA